MSVRAPALCCTASLGFALLGVWPASADVVPTFRECSDETAEACFTLVGMTVDGAHTVAPEALAPFYENYLARRISTSDLATIASDITGYYRRQGYFLSQAIVPAQGGESGVGRILVIEGRIAEVAFEGDEADAARRFFADVDTQGPARLADLDRRLALANDVPGLAVRARIEPDTEDMSRHRLIVSANLYRHEAQIDLDNRGSAAVGPWQAYGRYALNSALTSGDRIGLGVFATPFDLDEYVFAEANYSAPVGDAGRLGASVYVSQAHDGSDVQSSETGGDGAGVSVQFETPLLRRRGAGLWANGAFDARSIAYDWIGGGGYADELRVARVGLRGFLDEDGRSSTLLVQTSFGLDVLGASGRSLARRSRFDADASFSKLSVYVSHYHDIGRNFGVFASASAQWSDGPLLLSEEFSLGGPPFGRGYEYGALTGDRGWSGSLEFRAGYDPELALIDFAQAYLFLDGGQVWNEHSGDDALASTGAGLRLTIAGRFLAGLELARPLMEGAAGDKDWRRFISFSARY